MERMKIFTRWPLKVLLLSTLLVGCGKGEKKQAEPPKKILRINSATEPPTMDPRTATDHAAITSIMMTLEGLTRENPDGEPLLSIAEKVEISADKTHYTFHLRNTRWSNGRHLTAYDFEETWKRVLSPEFPAQFAYLMYVIKNAELAKQGKVSLEEVGVRATGPYLLEVELEHPVPYFNRLISTQVYLPYPDHIAKANEEALLHNKKKSYVGNGPFFIDQWMTHDSMIFTKNPLYWDAETVKLDGIAMSFVSDQSSVLQMYEENEIDWAGDPLSSLPEDSMPYLREENKLTDYPVAGVYYYVFNTKRFPFNNDKIRRAFSIAINRQEIIEHVTQKNHLPALRFLPHIMTDTAKEYFPDGDRQIARELFAEGLKEIGIRPSEFPTVPLKYNNTYPLHYKIAQAIQQQWRKTFNVRVDLESRDWKVYLDDLNKGNFLIARLGGVAIYNDPLYFLEYFIHENGNINYSRWNDNEFKQLINQVNETDATNERLSLLLKAEELLMQKMPIAPIFFYNMSYMKNNNVTGVYLSKLGNVDYKWADITEVEADKRI
jgi:oligopeptide transport system substrate-binding protein